MQQPATTESVASRFSTLERPLWALCLIAALAPYLRRLGEIPVASHIDSSVDPSR